MRVYVNFRLLKTILKFNLSKIDNLETGFNCHYVEHSKRYRLEYQPVCIKPEPRTQIYCVPITNNTITILI